MSKQDVAAESERLARHQQLLDTGGGPQAAMRRSRAALPAANARAQVLELLRKNLVMVISGATGARAAIVARSRPLASSLLHPRAPPHARAFACPATTHQRQQPKIRNPQAQNLLNTR